ncbi:hypothetical protein J2803_005180 [Paraburkholderia phenoliruptrix]|nr:hypothetical protein [Paraburkholderia phenoliruptrix]
MGRSARACPDQRRHACSSSKENGGAYRTSMEIALTLLRRCRRTITSVITHLLWALRRRPPRSGGRVPMSAGANLPQAPMIDVGCPQARNIRRPYQARSRPQTGIHSYGDAIQVSASVRNGSSTRPRSGTLLTWDSSTRWRAKIIGAKAPPASGAPIRRRLRYRRPRGRPYCVARPGVRATRCEGQRHAADRRDRR